jgi:type I restriction-modification system DNA methylase subunit
VITRTTTKQFDDDVLKALKTMRVTPVGSQFAGTLPEMAPSLYKKVKVAIETLGGKWNRTAQAHLFPADPHQELGLTIDTGQVRVTKELDGYFWTPRPVVERMIYEVGNLEDYHVVLEPSAGEGHIARVVAETIPKDQICCVELNGERAEKLRMQGFTLVARTDFLTKTPSQYGAIDFHRILMNPPFEQNQDIRHVQHAYKFLCPWGRLVAVVSEGVFYRKDAETVQFRAWLKEVDGEDIKLPDGSFKESGTGVSTRLVIIERSADG